VVSLKLHLGTEFHLYNAKRKIAELEPISEDLFEEKKAMLAQSAMSVGLSETLWKCIPCNKTFKSLEMLDEHKKSKKHKKSEKDFKKDNPTLPESSMFKSFCNEMSQGANSFMSDLQKSINGSEALTVEENEEEKTQVPVKTTMDSLRICLFCNKEFDGVKKNLDHMHIKHNFFLMDIECLVNLKGLLSYLAERI